MSLFFLMCSERSGSNFITKLMNGHENVCGPSTKHIINPVARNLFRYGDLTDESNWHDLLADMDRLLNVSFSVWKTTPDIQTMKSLAPRGDVTCLIRNVFLEEARANGKQHVFIKENHLYEFFPFLQVHFPEARYIYLTRDPRDVALSWKKNPDHPGGVVAAARQWRKDQVQSVKNHTLLAAAGRSYSVRYEDLTADPEAVCRTICSVLGIPFSLNMLDFYKDELTQTNANRVGAWNNLARPVMSNNSRKFAKELSPAEISAIETICFHEMKYFGYEPTQVNNEANMQTKSELEELAQEEQQSVPYTPADGVKANMEAKKRFYCRVAGYE